MKTAKVTPATAMTSQTPAEFVRWISTTFTKWTKANCGESWIDRGGDKLLTLDDGRFHARACANRSHGYLYLGAWMDAET